MLKYIKVEYRSSYCEHTIEHIKIQDNTVWFTYAYLEGYGDKVEFREWRKSSVDAEGWSKQLWNIVSKWHSSRDREERAKRISEAAKLEDTVYSSVDRLYFSPDCDYFIPCCDGRNYNIEFLFDDYTVTNVVMSNNYPDDFETFKNLIREVYKKVL